MKKSIITLMLAVMTALTAAAQPQVVAHRGYWRADGSAQNSIRSLVKADSVGCHATEFDVWISRDGTVFVNHDPTINGVEIQSSKAKDVARQRLPNGEPIPTLDALLSAAEPLGVRLVCELKPHADKQQELQAVKKIVAAVRRHHLESRTDYITFSYAGMKMLIKYAPKGSKVYYLNGELPPSTLKQLGAAGLDYNLRVMRRHPEWFAESRALGLETNVWTVDAEEHMQWLIEQGADYITTNEPLRLQQLLGK